MNHAVNTSPPIIPAPEAFLGELIPIGISIKDKLITTKREKIYGSKKKVHKPDFSVWLLPRCG